MHAISNIIFGLSPCVKVYLLYGSTVLIPEGLEPKSSLIYAIKIFSLSLSSAHLG